MKRITGEAIEVAQGQKKRIKGEVQQREELQKRLAAEVDERERLKKDNENSMKEREKLRKEIEDGVNERKKIEEQKAELARANVAADETVTRCEDFIMMLKQEMEERRRNASNQLAVQKNKLAEAERKIATQQALTKQAQTALREAIAAHAVIANSLQAQIVAEKDAAVKASADLEEKLSKEKRMEQEIALMKKNVADAMQAYSKIRNRVVELEQDLDTQVSLNEATISTKKQDRNLLEIAEKALEAAEERVTDLQARVDGAKKALDGPSP